MRSIYFLIILFANTGLVHSESALRASVDSLFAARRYEQVELIVLRAGDQLKADSPADQIAVNLTMGYSLIMLDREADAREYFRKALDVNPHLQLDPVRVSPLFRGVFDDVKANYQPPARTRSTESNSKWKSASRTSTLLNLILPGAGQWREGEPWRGVICGGLQAASLGVFVWRMQEFHNTRWTYLHQTDRQRVEHDYHDYDLANRWAWASGIAAAAIYVGSQVDLALLREPGVVKAVSIAPIANGSGIQLCIHW